ncbi:XRE family transcriptional regulator [Amycolatopsis sp. WAC 04182]|uniref:helix-turn-helix transcriptional regulator n=1 Tax=Amycolatopsis sp. WAC 04182 TaxID=2203198 RepID=UPI000F797916|nr:helix-turn-helix transcriptional regulator [Amycolatopsis sp. WAC 04182]RSN52636.1 XRE family transcriptional regulator [Amycolatopsis sp. WAC 04182]
MDNTSNAQTGSYAGQEPTEQEIVGRQLRIGRETLGLTQDDVAGVLGIPRTSVVAMEGGRRNVTALELRRLARLYRRSVQWLLGEEDSAAEVDSALYRATAELSEGDKEQVLRFAQFLATADGPPSGPGRRQAPPSFARGPRPGPGASAP